MLAKRFDGLAQSLGLVLPRRRVSALLAVEIGALTGGPVTAAKKKKKITICVEGRTRNVKKKEWQERYPGATKGECSSSGPQPATLQDASCTAAGPSTLGFAANQRAAQTFFAQLSGQLVTAQVQLTKNDGTTGDYSATINTVDNNGVPTNTVLATAVIPNANVVVGSSTATFNFASPATIVGGAQYALVISRTGQGPNQLNLRFDGGNPCVGGAFDSANQSAAFLSTGPSIDFDFKTFVRA
jgi:hypothetical protein